jgi:methylmalonyl-CoA mutase
VLTGARRPLVILAEFGDLTMRKARVGFVAGFLGVGGYDVQTRIVATPEELVTVAQGEKPDAIVLCSSDPEYLPLAEALPKNLCPNLIVAGQPETSEALLAAGVKDFIHIRCDLLETLGAYHDKFGIPEIPMNEPLDPRQMLAGSNA